MEFEKKYLGTENLITGEMIEVDATDRFRKEIQQISRECLDKLKMSKDRATESL